MNVKDMPLMEHIVELRKRLVIIAMFFVAFMVAGFFSLSRSLCIYKIPMKRQHLR